MVTHLPFVGVENYVKNLVIVRYNALQEEEESMLHHFTHFPRQLNVKSGTQYISSIHLESTSSTHHIILIAMGMNYVLVCSSCCISDFDAILIVYYLHAI